MDYRWLLPGNGVSGCGQRDSQVLLDNGLFALVQLWQG
jgi:hypothetical protein